jgi:hypothetical protein
MRWLKVVLTLSVSLVLVSACGGGDSDGARSNSSGDSAEQLPGATATLSAAERPDLSVEIGWFGVEQTTDVLRFLAYIRNSSDRPATGVRAEWTAYDASDVIVGNFSSDMPTIPAGETFPYVGGAGGVNLTGTPSRVEVKIADLGELDDKAASPFLDVENVRVEQSYQTSYDVRATLSAPDREIDPSTVKTNMILFDEKDEIILVDFIGDVQAPALIPAGQRFGVEFYVSLARRVPARAEVTAWTTE